MWSGIHPASLTGGPCDSWNGLPTHIGFAEMVRNKKNIYNRHIYIYLTYSLKNTSDEHIYVFIYIYIYVLP